MTQENSNLRDYYSTTDLALATTISLFCSLESIVYAENSSKAEFVFKRNKNLDELLESYWHQTLRVEPQAYFNQLRIIKSRLYERR